MLVYFFKLYLQSEVSILNTCKKFITGSHLWKKVYLMILLMKGSVAYCLHYFIYITCLHFVKAFFTLTNA